MNKLMVSNQEFNSLYQAKSIYVQRNFISIKVIENIFTNKTYYDYTIRFFNNDIDSFTIVNEDNSQSIVYQKKEILMAMESYIKKNNITDNNYLDKCLLLKEAISIDKLENNYLNQFIDIDVDYSKYKISSNKIIELLELPNDLFRERLNNNEIDGIKKEHFVYGIKKFIDDNNIVNNYYLDDNINNNINDILNYYVDIESLNVLLKTEDTLYSKVTIDEELESVILDSIPNEFNLLEKSIYVYIMLCRLLSYNEEFYSLNESTDGEIVDYKDVKRINLKNNSVKCYDFNLLYSVFLHKLGINFKSEYDSDLGEDSYGTAHVKMYYRVGKYLILSDSTESILEGDMINTKVGEAIQSLRVINKNEDTKKEFNNSLNKVYDYIKNKYNYKKVVKPEKNTLSVNDRLKIIIDELNKRKLTGVDAMGYLLRLRKIFFNDVEWVFNIKINVVANTRTNDNRISKLSAIIRINETDLENGDTKYYLYEPGVELEELSFNEINERFERGELSYLESDCNLIPNIKRRN